MARTPAQPLASPAAVDPAAEAIERRFAEACQSLPPLRAGARLALGCSCGGDSMALLHLMRRQADPRGWTLTVAHLDHAQRPESAEEARWLGACCEALRLPMATERLAPGWAGGGRSEEDLRQARLDFFARVTERAGAEAIVLAHQADDCAETFLMRLLAGSGPTGLAAIRPVQRLGELTLARPLLEFRRAELRDYLRVHGIPWLDDPANQDRRLKRVWVREELLPLLNPRADGDAAGRVARAARLIGEEAAALTEACRELLLMLVEPAEPPGRQRLRLDHELWRRAGPGLRRRLMRQWLASLRRSPYPPGRAAVEEAVKFAERAALGAELRTIERLRLIKGSGALEALPPSPPEASEPSRQ